MSAREQIYLLDTNVLSEFSKKRPSRAVAHWAVNATGRLAIPVAAVFEIQRGIGFLEKECPEKARALDAWLHDILDTDLEVVPLGLTAGMLYARMTIVSQLKNLWLPKKTRGDQMSLGQDLCIAAIAISLPAVVVTMNVKDFLVIHEAFPLPGIFDPSTGRWHVFPDGRRPLELVSGTSASEAVGLQP